MRANNVLAIFLGCTALVAAADADFLDRVKRKLDDAKSETQDARNDVNAVTQADERIESAATGAVPNPAQIPAQIDNRAAAEIENTEAVQTVRGAERDANAVATVDERAQAQVQGEITAEQREIERALDVESRARDELNRTEPVAEARQTEREVNAVLTADERAKLEVQRERAELERAADFD